jgi:hypothetical protein
VRVRAVTLLALAGLAAGCGGGHSGQTAGPAPQLTPNQVRANLIHSRYKVSSFITHGANEAVAQNGKLNADSVVSINYDPDGNQLYASVYFFSNGKDAKILADEFKKNDAHYHDHPWAQRGTRVYDVSGTQDQLDAIVSAGEGD